MIQRPRQLAHGARTHDEPAPVPGLDFDRARRRVAAAGGDPVRFAAAVAAAQRCGAEAPDAVDVAGIAAWAAGALALRDDALSRIERMLPHRADVVAAALGLDAADVGAFAEHQRSDRFWWPGRGAANGYVCAVGGFAGLGGAWVAAPEEARTLDDGVFAVRTGAQWWRLDADVWGARLVTIEDEPVASARAGASVVVRADSYLVWVHVAEAA